MGLVVIKPDGITWGGKEYPFGGKLPSEVVQHENFPALVTAGYVTYADSPEALKRGLAQPEDVVKRHRSERSTSVRSLKARPDADEIRAALKEEEKPRLRRRGGYKRRKRRA